MSWVNLEGFSTVHEILFETLPIPDIAFASKSKSLAFQGCVEHKCGVFILVIDTHEIKRVYLEEGVNITWSPDSNYLAWQGTRPAFDEPGMFMADIKSGEITYYEIGNLEINEFSATPMVVEWTFELLDPIFGLGACSMPC